MRCLPLACLLFVVVHEQLGAQSPVATPTVPRRPATPFAVVSSTSYTTRTTDARHASLVPRERVDFGMSIDSAPSGSLYARMVLELRVRPAIIATARVPLRDGTFQVPQFALQPPRTSPTDAFGRMGGSLPQVEAEPIAIHRATRRLIELGALFESDPITAATTRRVTHFADGSGDVSLVIDAVRESRTLRDTIVKDRRAHVVRDSTFMTLSHAYATPARFVDRVTRAREVLRGTIIGVRLVDVESHRTFAMSDTLVMQGTLQSDDGLGGQVRGPLFVRTIRESTFRDAVWQAAFPREPFDMVRYDGGSRQAPTAAQVDSLFQRLGTAPAISTRDSIRTILTTYNALDMWPRVKTRSLVIGDTGSVVAWLGNEAARPRRSISDDEYRLIRRALTDANAAFRTGVDRELMVVNLIDGLVYRPPVLVASTLGGDEALACTPTVCRAMAADARTRGNMHLQAIGLVAAMVTTPRQWTDSVLKYAATNPFLTGRVLALARGNSTDAVASAKAPIPDPDAPYGAWMYWMRGQDSAYVRARDSDPALRQMAASMNQSRRIEVTEGAATAIRFAEVRTGRDYAAAFRRARDVATADSVKALYNALLIAMNDPVYSPAEMVRIMLSPTSPEREAVRAQLMREGRRGLQFTRASDAVASVIGRHVVNMVFGDSSVSMPSVGARTTRWLDVPKAADTLPRFIIMDSLPASVRARAAELGFNPVEPGWRLTPGASAYQIRIDPIRQQGPFVLVFVTHTTLYSRSAARSGGYAGGFALWFAEGPNGWVVVDVDAWVT